VEDRSLEHQVMSRHASVAGPREYRRLLLLVPWTAAVSAATLLGALVWLRSSHAIESASLRTVVDVLVVLVTIGAAVFTMWRFELAARYAPIGTLPSNLLPPITVVVPAYNEGRPVYDTLMSIADGDYPADRLQLVAIDDGSRDDTWAWMREAERVLGERLELVRLPHNQGKRHALAAGFERATGSVLVTIDSDSIVRRDALRHLVSPLAADPRVGGVAGNIRVMATQRGLWARVFDNAFTYSFEVVRAAQSVLGAVMCTPGAAAAYRRDLVMDALPAWRDETFLGRPANIGEDRGLTNAVLRAGFSVVFQSTAVVETLVPSSLQGARRMLLRWARSNVRESMVLLSFVFTGFRRGSLLGVRVLAVQEAVSLVFAGVGFVFFAAAVALRPMEVLAASAVVTLLASTIPALSYALLRGCSPVWAFANGLLGTFLLPWITPWSLCTPHHGGWLTRERKPTGPTQIVMPVKDVARDSLAALASRRSVTSLP
jgi:hyaluronan synthase